MSPPKNSLQAVLERQAQSLPVSLSAEQATQASTASPPSVAQRGKFHRPSRDGRRLIAGHFDPKVAKQLKLLAAEEDTTVQALLEEALNLLFVKKGRGTIKGA